MSYYISEDQTVEDLVTISEVLEEFVSFFPEEEECTPEYLACVSDFIASARLTLDKLEEQLNLHKK
jgi:CBS domain containing-hemolysin-like protein